ncbi:hypothetical protein LIER_37658 [Lithospermum erythrorhizon]|uniref:Uncharacterized protein n=1 Tax=Lithospermum erythrorhizon TaxID=34254 RepID=A0AAV3PPW3_LITER
MNSCMAEEVAPKAEEKKPGLKCFNFHFIRPIHKWTGLPESKLIYIIRSATTDEPTPATTKLLASIRMWKPDTLVFAKADQTLMRILRKLRPYVDYGYIM